MPTIESKKYGHTQYVSAETWNDFKRLGKDRFFKVIDDGDLQETVIPAPESITDFQGIEPTESPIEVEAIPEMSREEIKAELNKLVEEEKIEPYNVRASTDKLYKLYLEQQ